MTEWLPLERHVRVLAAPPQARLRSTDYRRVGARTER